MSFSSILAFNFDDQSVSNELSLDHYQRLHYLKSSCQQFFYLFEKRELDQKIEGEVIGLFRKRYGFCEVSLFIDIWNEVGSKVWTVKSTLTAGLLRKIDAAFQEKLLYHGAGIPSPLSVDVGPSVQAVVKALLHGAPFPKSAITKDVIKTVLTDHTHQDSQLTKEFLKAIQIEFTSLAANLPKNEKEEVLWRAFCGNLIALLPFCYPNTGVSMLIPILSKDSDGAYSSLLVSYRVEEINLSLSKMSSPMKALGLTAIENNGPPLLTYSGTTYPGGEGFATTLLADFTPGNSVGEVVYEQNREAIEQWLNGKQGVHVYGMSLGGALALHTLNKSHSEVVRIDAYNPPGLYPGQWVSELNKECSINIWCQSGDFVSYLGAWPADPHVSLYLLIPHQKEIASGISAHARVFSGCPEVAILKLDHQADNNGAARFCLTTLHKAFSWLIYGLIMGFLLMGYVISSISKPFRRTVA